MDQSGACSFIIKIWLEETAEESGTARWRGHITHVPGGDRRYFQRLKDVETFVSGYLQEMGVVPSLSWRLRTWLGKLKAHRAGRE
jgi:hypothetical protein